MDAISRFVCPGAFYRGMGWRNLKIAALSATTLKALLVHRYTNGCQIVHIHRDVEHSLYHLKPPVRRIMFVLYVRCTLEGSNWPKARSTIRVEHEGLTTQ